MPVTEFTGYFVLTFEYSDKSAFRVCGVTQNPSVALAWFNGGADGQNKVYQMDENDIKPTVIGFTPWTPEVKA